MVRIGVWQTCYCEVRVAYGLYFFDVMGGRYRVELLKTHVQLVHQLLSRQGLAQGSKVYKIGKQNSNFLKLPCIGTSFFF